MTTEIFPLNIGEGKMLNISIADKPIIVNGYVHLQAGEYQSLAYKLRDDQAESFREWLDRNTGLIDLNEGDKTVPLSEFQKYRRSQTAELRPYMDGEVLPERVSISAPDKEAGSPKVGDMIARNPANHDDQWLVAKVYFEANFEPA